ncbi:hypothetical protein DP091_08885 [Paenibacillus sp. MDMC362]|nr:hypothetical protein DP091_08885 [Paenibacillus sp. MDMC362]
MGIVGSHFALLMIQVQLIAPISKKLRKELPRQLLRYFVKHIKLIYIVTISYLTFSLRMSFCPSMTVYATVVPLHPRLL